MSILYIRKYIIYKEGIRGERKRFVNIFRIFFNFNMSIVTQEYFVSNVYLADIAYRKHKKIPQQHTSIPKIQITYTK